MIPWGDEPDESTRCCLSAAQTHGVHHEIDCDE